MDPARIRTFEDLVVWRTSFELTAQIYRSTNSFPKHERFGLSAELRKTSRSVLDNIAEGHKRGSTREYIQFLHIAAGSAAELESQPLLGEHPGYFGENCTTQILNLLAEVQRM